ncbi:MAG TPA: alpha/beta hydrolase [Candidatus Methylomirabilis sp.]|nr:alpha/beta hydrolase [Candidatus Methylomirabilis sp.]
MGSELYTETPDIIWIDPIDYIPDPFDLKLDSLKMDDQGNSKIKLIAPDIIRSVYGSDFYGGLIKYLEDKGYKEGTDLFVFPYDWRMDLDQVAGDNFPCQSTTTLKCLIDEVKQKTKSEKIDIIAHSMGGLVVKDYVAKFGQESIDKFIDMATPHLGTPLAAKILNYGDNLDIGYGYYFLSTGKVRDVSQNMPAIYQLLPSQQYFNLPDNEYEYYIENSLATKINLPTGELNYLDSIEFLSKTGNENRYYFLNKNFILHSQIDNIKIGNSYNISGCGIATVGKIKSEGKKAFFWNKYSIEYIDGDNTVPLRSSDYYGDKNREYYLKGGGHSQIPGNEAVKEFVGLILAGKENEFNFSAHNNFSQSDDICGISGYELSFHCPADMHVYDDQGNHVGPVTNNDIENNIPGAHYDIIDGNKFVFLPQGKNYKIIGESTGTGTLEIAVNTVENNEYTKTTYFNSIPLLSNSTNVELNLGDNQANIAVKVDENGDGVFEEEKTPDSILTGEEMDDLVKPETIISLFGAKENNGYYGSDVKIDLAATDDNSGVLKTEYSLDKGKTWINYVREFALTQNGTTTILYSSTDRAGNREENKTEIIKIDTEKPELIILLPQENQEIEHNKILNVEYLANDQYSGLSELPEIYFDGQKMEGGNVDLFNYSIGQHKIKLKVSDLAGNYSEKENSFYVTASIDSAISDIERLYSEKEIFKEKTKDDLIDDFNWINEYQERNSKKEIRREGIEKEILDKCIAKKGNNWCEEKIGKVLDKILYRMDNVSQKLLKLKYELISQKVYRYKKIDWLTNKAVSIIEDNIKYLINNIK